MSAIAWEDFDPKLLTKNIADRARPGGRHHPRNCGPCEDCAEFLLENRGGRLPAGHPGIDLKGLLRHARRFGTECIYETVIGVGLSTLELRRLRMELDTIDAAKPGRARSKPRKRSRAETRVMVQALVGKGWTRREIAEEMHVADKTVDNYLAPGALSATQGLGGAVFGIKPPANRGVKRAQLAMLPTSQAEVGAA